MSEPSARDREMCQIHGQGPRCYCDVAKAHEEGRRAGIMEAIDMIAPSPGNPSDHDEAVEDALLRSLSIRIFRALLEKEIND